MKTAKLLFGAMLCIGFCSVSAPGQTSGKNGVSPIYIPGDTVKTDSHSESKKLPPVSKVKTTRKYYGTPITGSRSTTNPTTSPISSSLPEPATVSTPTRIIDADHGCGVGCGCGTPCGCADGCGAGCGDQVGQSFFGRLRERSPIKVNFVGADEMCNCGAECDCCCSCDNRRGLRRFLPTVCIRTNACNKYRSIYGGWVDLEDYDGDAMGNSRLISFNDGWSIGLARGRRFPNGFRLESDTTIRHTTVDEYQQGSFVGMDFVPTATFDAIDSVYSISNMNNILYDFRRFGPTVPYVGIGAGGIFVDGDIVTPGLGRTDYIDDGAFAYQFIVGLSRRINTRVEAFTEFRHLGTSGLDIETDTNMGGPDLDGEFDYQNNNLVFGLRFTIPNSQGQ